MRTVRALAALALLVPACLVGIPLQWIAGKIGSRAAARIPLVFHRWVNQVLGIRRILNGAPAEQRPLLLVSNHVSWIDITVLSAILPVSFIAKSEVGTWPLFGGFARLQRSVFVDRTRRGATLSANRQIAERLAGGDVMVLFGEGTSSDGTRVLSFRSALLGAVRDAAASSGEAVSVQATAITYVRRHGMPISHNHRAELAWYGGMDLLPHLWDVLGGGAIDVVISFGSAMRIDASTDRKELARHLEEEVRQLNRTAIRQAVLKRP